ncbi:MAG TPA: hypothetical protein VF755_12650, partial [Catenuloplanes sp.]
MRRTTAAAVGTVTGTALIMAVRLSVTTAPVAAPPPAFDLADVGASEQVTPTPTASPPARPGRAAGAKPSPTPSR